MEKSYLTLEQTQQLFQSRSEQYSNHAQVKKMSDPLDNSFYTIVTHVQAGKVKVFQRTVNGLVHTFIEFEDGTLSTEEKEQIVKIANFLMKIEVQLGYPSAQ